jgi:UDP-N-acetyl-D-mannosaminuronate dehydrogenase
MMLATSYELYIEKIQEIEKMSLQMILHKITKINTRLESLGKKTKPVKWLTLGLNYKINMQLLNSILIK